MFKKLIRKTLSPIKKLVRKVGGFFGRVMNKLGPLGMLAMMFAMPYIAGFWGQMGSWVGGTAAGGTTAATAGAQATAAAAAEGASATVAQLAGEAAGKAATKVALKEAGATALKATVKSAYASGTGQATGLFAGGTASKALGYTLKTLHNVASGMVQGFNTLTSAVTSAVDFVSGGSLTKLSNWVGDRIGDFQTKNGFQTNKGYKKRLGTRVSAGNVPQDIVSVLQETKSPLLKGATFNEQGMLIPTPIEEIQKSVLLDVKVDPNLRMAGGDLPGVVSDTTSMQERIDYAARTGTSLKELELKRYNRSLLQAEGMGSMAETTAYGIEAGDPVQEALRKRELSVAQQTSGDVAGILKQTGIDVSAQLSEDLAANMASFQDPSKFVSGESLLVPEVAAPTSWLDRFGTRTKQWWKGGPKEMQVPRYERDINNKLVLDIDNKAIRLPGYDTITVDEQSALGRLGSKIGEEITDLPQSMVRGETEQWINKKIYGDPKQQTLPSTTLPLEGLSYTQQGELPETLVAVNSYNNLNNGMYSPNPLLPYNKQNMQGDYGQGGIYGV
jgi:hypothetical protein